MERHIKICRANQKVMAEGGILCVTCGKWAETNTALKNHITTKGKFHNNKCAYSEQCPDVTFSTWQEFDGYVGYPLQILSHAKRTFEKPLCWFPRTRYLNAQN